MLIKDYEVSAAACSTLEALWTLVGTYFQDTVVEKIVYLHLPPFGSPDELSPGLRADGFPEELVSRYLTERLFRDNPMLRHGRASTEPVYWDDIAREPTLTQRERDFVALLQGLGGVGIPVYGPNGRVGHCGLGFRTGVRRLGAKTLREFQWVCQLCHLRYCDMLQETLGRPPALSNREIEVLALVARGKSNAAIGQILGISPHTVDAHLRHIYEKLGVSDRISASVRGIGVGLIQAGG